MNQKPAESGFGFGTSQTWKWNRARDSDGESNQSIVVKVLSPPLPGLAGLGRNPYSLLRCSRVVLSGMERKFEFFPIEFNFPFQPPSETLAPSVCLSPPLPPLPSKEKKTFFSKRGKLHYPTPPTPLCVHSCKTFRVRSTPVSLATITVRHSSCVVVIRLLICSIALFRSG